MERILFIGNFLSSSTGTVAPTEKLKRYLKEFRIIQASGFNNKALRFCDFIIKTTFYKFKSIHIDIYSGKAQYFAIVVTVIAKLRKKNIILNLMGGKLSLAYKENPKILSYCFNKASSIITPSKFLQNYFNSIGYQVDHLPNFIDLKQFDFKETSSRKPYTLLWVRAFAEIYQPDLAIKALYEVKKIFKDAKLTMIGPDKGLLPLCMKLIDDFGLQESVKIVGPVTNDRLHKYYDSHHVFINTTQYESFGMAVLEAAACGIPIVSTKVGELPLLWEENKEILFTEVTDVSGMASQIIKIFKVPGLGNMLCINARKKAENFNWEVIKPKWIELLKV